MKQTPQNSSDAPNDVVAVFLIIIMMMFFGTSWVVRSTVPSVERALKAQMEVKP